MVAAMVVVAVVGLPASASASDCAWSVAVLPLPDGAEAAQVTAADGDGWLAGLAGDSGGFDTEGVLWRHGKVLPLGQAFGMSTRLAAVNQNGVAVGAALASGELPDAVRYRGGQWERLEESGYEWTGAQDVNLGGDVAGVQLHQDGFGRFVVWAVDGVTPVRELPMPSPNEMPMSVYLDDDGTAAGYSHEFDPSNGAITERAYVWTLNGTRTQLEAPVSPEIVEVWGFRDGRLVGRTAGPDGLLAAAEWDVDGKFVRFFPGGIATGVNRAGMTLGTVSYYDNSPVVWLPDGTAEPLPAPGGFARAFDINDEQVGGYVGTVPLVWTRTC